MVEEGHGFCAHVFAIGRRPCYTAAVGFAMPRGTMQYGAGLSVWTAAAVAASQVLRLVVQWNYKDSRPYVGYLFNDVTFFFYAFVVAATFAIGAVLFRCTWRVGRSWMRVMLLAVLAPALLVISTAVLVTSPLPAAGAGKRRAGSSNGVAVGVSDGPGGRGDGFRRARPAGVSGLVVVLLPSMTEDELQAALERTTPERDRYELFVEEAQDQDVRIRFSPPVERLVDGGAAHRGRHRAARCGRRRCDGDASRGDAAARGRSRRRDRVVARDPARPRDRPCRGLAVQPRRHRGDAARDGNSSDSSPFIWGGVAVIRDGGIRGSAYGEAYDPSVGVRRRHLPI